MPRRDEHTPHKALLALHRLVDAGIEPLIRPLGLDFATESIITVDRSELDSLSVGGDPNAVLLSLDPGPQEPAVLIAEPNLCSTVLNRIWRSERSTDAPMTPVEGAILQQFLSDLCAEWKASWQRAGLSLLPNLTLATTLSMLAPQMTDGPWYVARTVVLDGNDEVGVLLFCYPARLMPTLVEARNAISWRQRIERGLTDHDRDELNDRLNRMASLTMPAPVTFRMDLPLRMINQLERGDVIALDGGPTGDLHMKMLDREVTGRLARHGANLAVCVTGPDAQTQALETDAYADSFPTNPTMNGLAL